MQTLFVFVDLSIAKVENSVSFRRPLLLSLILTVATITPPAWATKTASKQFVIVSFDGAHNNALWDKSRSIAKRTGAQFTYFLSCTFLMTRKNRATYHAPGQKVGQSNVGFAANEPEVRQRLKHIWKARGEGHEIASHGCGHFDGKSWSQQDWAAELSAFSLALDKAWQRIGAAKAEPEGWSDFVRRDITGFRAPYLSVNGNMTVALKEAGYAYDASGVSRGPAMPRQIGDFITFDLPLINEGPKNRRVIAMDYNLFVRHSGGLENASKSALYEERSYGAFRKAFDEQYQGERRPLQLGFHFVEMNGGAYWRAMERLLSDVCGLPDVACVSYRDAIEQMKLQQNGDGGA